MSDTNGNLSPGLRRMLDPLRAVNSKVLEGGDIQGSALGKWRMNFGLYFYAEPMDAPQPEELQRDGT